MRSHGKKNYQVPRPEGTAITVSGERLLARPGPNPKPAQVVPASSPLTVSRSGRSWNLNPGMPISASVLA